MTIWCGPIPKTCDTCDEAIKDMFYDAQAQVGHRKAWAHMCPTCFTLGPGFNKLGLGHGQEYTMQPDGKFLKTGG